MNYITHLDRLLELFFLTYTSKHAAASIKVTKDGKVVLDADYGARKTVLIDDDVIHLPEGIGGEV